MKKRDKNTQYLVTALKAVILIVFIGFFFYVIGNRSLYLMRHSEYFKIRQILYDSGSEFIKSSRLASLKDKNILDVDLEDLQRHLERQYPEISQLQIYRRFPNQLVVIARKRVAFARATMKNRNVILDQDGVILASSGEVRDLPVIQAEQFTKIDPTPGSPIKSAEVKWALQVIKDFQDHEGLDQYQVSKVNVDNLSQIYFYISKITRTPAPANLADALKPVKPAKDARIEELKIIIDRENIPHKMKILELVLSQARPEFDNVQYIDLRFKEPILGNKELPK